MTLRCLLRSSQFGQGLNFEAALERGIRDVLGSETGRGGFESHLRSPINLPHA